MQYENNVLHTSLKDVKFDYPIKQVAKYRGIYIVLISPVDSLELPLNVYGVNDEGDIIWKIKRFNEKDTIYASIEVDIENNKVYLKDLNFFKYIIDVETGEIISGKLKPLDNQPTTIKNDNKTMNLNKNNNSNNIFDKYINKKTIIAGISLVGIILLLINSSKNMKISTLEKANEESLKRISTLETVIVTQEEKITQYEQLIATYEAYITNAQSQTTQTIQNQSGLQDIGQTQEENRPNESQNTQNQKPNSGLNSVIGFIDSVFDNVSQGNGQSIDDIEKLTTTTMHGSVTEILDGQHFVANIDGTPTQIELISVSECKKETLETLIPVGTTVFLEKDTKSTDEDGNLMAYVWVSEPDKNQLTNMVNYVLIKNKYAKFINCSPNVKYQRYFFT